jgi:hypothetical protein
VFCLFQQTAFILHFISEFCFVIVPKIRNCFILHFIKNESLKLKMINVDWFLVPVL